MKAFINHICLEMKCLMSEISMSPNRIQDTEIVILKPSELDEERRKAFEAGWYGRESVDNIPSEIDFEYRLKRYLQSLKQGGK